MTALAFWGWCLFAYLLGSVSWSYFIVKARKGIDLRTVASGNLGATNAGRVLGKRWAVIIYFLDLLKGLIGTAGPWLLVADPRWRELPLPVVAGLLVILGHVFPFYLRFRGGKGVATGSGVLFALAPTTGAGALVIWYLCLRASRMVSLASVVAALALPLLFPLLQRGPLDWWREGFLAVIALFVTVTHRSNIARILRGEENKLGAPRT
ncbi:MAG: glycerol-3-phosphate 1-O-acyltransferase PlsY [Planctomycetes bacterium]|nr:glycerol-3-phosphate 1-O-acyltransferase PlsY [Planctomycetota bacterium]